jgi:hypothetical protein
MTKEIVKFPSSDGYPESTIAKFVSGKRVAIVGGSPKIIGTELGEYIDSHDIVVRVNLHWPCPRRLMGGDGVARPEINLTRDIGNRTDILFHNGNKIGGSLEEVKDLQGLKHVIMLGSLDREMIYDAIMAWCEEQSIPCLWFDQYYSYLRYPKCLGGMMALFTMLEHDVKELFVAGYGFYDSEPNYRKVNQCHRPKQESEIFKEHILPDKRVILADHVKVLDESYYTSQNK